MTVQSNNNNLNYFIDPTFTKVQQVMCFVIWKNWRKNVEKIHKDSLSHYYVPNVEIKDFTILIDGKIFFDLPVKNEEEVYRKVMSVNRNNEYKTGNLLDFAYFKENIWVRKLN